MDKQPIIHCGLPKCASTFLQKIIFPYLNYEIKDERKYGELSYKYLKDTNNNFIKNLPNENNCILSNEQYLHIDIPIPLKKHKNISDKEIFISNIKELFRKRGKVLVVIRRQDDLVGSWIKYYTRFIRKKHFFIDYPIVGSSFKDGYLKNRYGITTVSTFNYYDIFSKLNASIDKSRIYILTIEDLRHNPEYFFKRLGECVEEDLSRFVKHSNNKVNTSSYNLEVKNLGTPRFINKLIPNKIKLNIKKLILREKKEDKFDKKIMELYKDGNKKLAEKFNLDIKKYGYY